jgi:hypothetical protein
MNTVDGRNADPRPAALPGRSRPFPMWVLQVTELIIAFVFIDISVHVNGGWLLVAAAIPFAALAVTAEGPLGLVRVCPPRLHIALVVAVAAVLAATPLVPALRPDIQGIIVLEFGAIGLIRVATLTRTTPPPRLIRTKRGARTVIDTTAAVVDPADRAERDSERSPSPPGAGTAGPAGSGTARRAGRAAGAASASGKRLVAKHRPAAEAQVKTSIRTAGRWAGRWITRPDDQDRGH